MATTWLPVINPATGEAIDRLPCDNADSVGHAVACARAAQPAWAAHPLAARIAAIERFGDRLQADREPLARLLTAEVGKPIAQARAEIAACAQRIAFFTAEVSAALADDVVSRDATQGLEERITYEPLGVVANISAWNYPYFVGLNVLVPALLAGNAVLYKPSEYAARTGRAIVERLHDAGVPRDVVLALIGAGEVGAALATQPVDGMFFTGSYATGRCIAQAVGERMIRVQLELGGKDPVYVCEDVPIAFAVPTVADGAFYNTGQSCCAVERLYVHRSIYAAFVDAFVERVRGFRVGDPMAEDTYIGPLARAAQLDVLDAQVQGAVARGARVLCGGKRLPGPGHFFAPTVLVDVDSSMAVMRDESFGPVIGIQAVDDDVEAVARMNDTAYGLTAGVYTPDAARARRILAQLDTGSVYWNCCDRVSPRLPWSGRRHSGIGVTLSREGLRAFVRPKAWHLRAGR
jgi:acyl-CoA reductase-like NAD-dependent aldehyde dehydrogenase